MVSQLQYNHFSQQKDHQDLWFHSCNLTTSLNKKTIKSYGFHSFNLISSLNKKTIKSYGFTAAI